MEEYLKETEKALTAVLGEQGLSSIIVNDVRDLMVQPIVQTIQLANSADAVCNELRQHPKIEKVCHEGLKRLKRLLMDTSILPPASLLNRMVAMDLVELILSSMSNHVTNADIQVLGCWLLSELVQCSAGKDWFNVLLTGVASSRGFSAILAAVEQHPNDHAGVLKHALSCLRHICENCQKEEISLCPFVVVGGIPFLSMIFEHQDACFHAADAVNIFTTVHSSDDCRPAFENYAQQHPKFLTVAQVVIDSLDTKTDAFISVGGLLALIYLYLRTQHPLGSSGRLKPTYEK